MSLNKLLGIISIVIVVMFSLMLTTSYAWYSFDNASTKFSAHTNNENIMVSYQSGEYINTDIAVPIKNEDIDKYSEKNNFSIKVRSGNVNTEMLATISLVDIVIDGALQNANFKIELYHQNSKVAEVSGNTIGTSGATTKKLASITLDDTIDNNFELRLYILDNGGDQSALMGKKFQAKIQVDAVSKLKATFDDYSGSDIYISNITIDGVAGKTLPTSGYYNMTYSCTKGSNLSWEPLSKTLTYNGGSKVGDTCNLTFTSSTSYPLLNKMPVGSYVKYVGNNGCDSKSCAGQNENYVNDKNMGYCNDNGYKFGVNGWRIGYIKDGSAYLVSAGSPECYRTYMDSKSTSTSSVALNTNYYYGSNYKFDSKTGKFSLTGVTSSALAWSSNYKNIIEYTPYTCKGTSSTATCDSLYEVTAYSNTTNGLAYTHYNYDSATDVSTHINSLNRVARKYCNKTYAYGGTCDDNSTWNFQDQDFQNITLNMGIQKTLPSCFNSSGNMDCGYTNTLIDNGGTYWFASPAGGGNIYAWSPLYRKINKVFSRLDGGVRPVLRLQNSVVVTGGTGTYEDPYTIKN